MSASYQTLSNPTVAIVGATGAVGIELIRCLEERNFPVKALRLLASKRSAGKMLPFRGQQVAVQELNDAAFDGVELALFSAGSGPSKQYGPVAVAKGAVVVDNSSAFRMDADIPLVVPEINAQALEGHKGIVANPNCAAIISLVPLWPLHRRNPIRRLIVATYQAASGAGAAAMEELRLSTEAYLQGREYKHTVLPHPYAFNLFSHNTAIDPATGYNGEESKVIAEARKIFGEPGLPVSATCVRVPVLRAHSVAITVEFAEPMSPDRARALIADAPGVRLVDDAANNHFPMPIEASGQDDILVGRIRQDVSDPSGKSISMFVAGDQLLKGAALNAVQIAELLLK
jgi:aspartate-semialdehyde dehydrogenase